MTSGQADANGISVGGSIRIALYEHRIKNGQLDGKPIYYANSWLLDTHTPAKCNRFIRKFDDDKPVKPFSFTLHVPNGLTEEEQRLASGLYL